MRRKFKKGLHVIVRGFGKSNGHYYPNISGRIIEMDPYYNDYLVKFKNGTEDWFSPKYIRYSYSKKKRS